MQGIVATSEELYRSTVSKMTLVRGLVYPLTWIMPSQVELIVFAAFGCPIFPTGTARSGRYPPRVNHVNDGDACCAKRYVPRAYRWGRVTDRKAHSVQSRSVALT